DGRRLPLPVASQARVNVQLARELRVHAVRRPDRAGRAAHSPVADGLELGGAVDAHLAHRPPVHAELPGPAAVWGRLPLHAELAARYGAVWRVLCSWPVVADAAVVATS